MFANRHGAALDRHQASLNTFGTQMEIGVDGLTRSQIGSKACASKGVGCGGRITEGRDVTMPKRA
jgi:hypothetical protein